MMLTVVFRVTMIELLACMSGAVLSDVGGSTEVQPG
jgi:hypothetical protein